MEILAQMLMIFKHEASSVETSSRDSSEERGTGRFLNLKGGKVLLASSVQARNTVKTM